MGIKGGLWKGLNKRDQEARGKYKFCDKYRMRFNNMSR